MKPFAFTLLTIGAIYTLLPWVVTRILGIGVFRKGGELREIALTFDDGPNPEYTPQLLDLLRRHRVKATFFVLGAKAARYPELIRRIHHEGHQIGLHNYEHKSNWLMMPWTVLRQVRSSAAQIEAITGEQPTFYRPPWGIFNLFDLVLLKKEYTFVLWSVLAHDWRSRVGRNRLKSILQERITDGSVVLLHDCGETAGADIDAPLHMLRVLDSVLPELAARGFRCVRVDEMSGRAHSHADHDGRLTIRS